MAANIHLSSISKMCCIFIATNRRAVLLTSILFLLCTKLSAQQLITGVITGVDHTPLFSATVIVKNTSRATTTDANGHFSIAAKTGDVLIVSYVGYMTKEIKLGNEPALNISLYESIPNLDEIIVTGY